MRVLVSFLGLLVVAGLWGASAFINYRFGTGWGDSEIDKQAFGIIAVLFDAAKAILPFIIAWAFMARRWLVVAPATLGLVVCIALSGLSAIGYGAKARAQNTGKWLQKNERLESWKSERDRKRKTLVGLPSGKRASVIDSELRGLRQDKRWTSTKKCVDATAKKSRIFCKQYFALEGAEKNARQVEKLETEITALNENIAKNAGSSASKNGDPQAAMLGKLIGTTPENMQTAIVLIFGFGMELFAGLGFFMMLRHGGFEQKREQKKLAKEQNNKRKLAAKRQKKRQVGAGRDLSGSGGVGRGWSSLVAMLSPKRTGRAGEFAKECVAYQEDNELGLTSFYEAYRAWCKLQDQRPLAKTRFENNITSFLADNSWKTKQGEGETVWLHMSLKKPQKAQLKAVA